MFRDNFRPFCKKKNNNLFSFPSQHSEAKPRKKKNDNNK